jgi:hypothetical protein
MIIITESSNYFKKGQLIEEYINEDEGIKIKEHFIPKKSFIVLNEDLTPSDEKKIKALIKKALKDLFWNLYTKRNVVT